MSYLLVLMACINIGEPGQYCTTLEIPMLEKSECNLERNRVRFLLKDNEYKVKTFCTKIWYG